MIPTLHILIYSGESIPETIKAMVGFADDTNSNVVTFLNDTRVKVHPGDDPKEVLSKWTRDRINNE